MATGDLVAQDRQVQAMAFQQADWRAELCARRVCIAAIVVMLMLGIAGCGNGPPARGLWPFSPALPPRPSPPPAAATDSEIAEWQKGLQNGDYPGVIEQTQQFLRLHPDDPEGLLYLGLALIANGDAKSANDPLRYVYAHPEFPWERDEQDWLLLYRGLMVVHAQAGEPVEAEYCFKKALQIAPDRENIIRHEYDSRTLSVGDLVP